MSNFKTKPVRLKGHKLIELYQRVYDKSGGCCVECGRWVEPGTIPHHIQHKSQGGEDTEENLELLCIQCHDKRHNKGEEKWRL